MKPSRFGQSRNDDGVALVLVLVFISLVGLFATVALNKAGSTADSVTQLQGRTALQYTLDGGVDKSLQTLTGELATGSTPSCSAPGTTTTLSVFSLNGASATPTCSTLAGHAYTSSDTSSTNFALIVTSPNPGALTSSNAVTHSLDLNGSVYLNGKVANGDLGKPLQVTAGDLVSPISRSNCASDLIALTQITLTGTGQLRQCTEQSLNQALPTVILPTAPTYNVSTALGGGLLVNLAGGKTCQVFYPGLYTSAPVLSAANYFVSGIYSFSNVGVWQIAGGSTVIGGQRGASLDNPVPTGNCTTMTDATALAQPGVASALASIAPYRFTYGTTWVFGGTSSLDFRNGTVTLFSPPPNGSSQPINLVGATSTMTGYPSKTQGSVVVTGGTNNTSMQLNAKLFAPTTAVSIFSTNNTTAAVLGGVVAYTVDLQASASGNDGVVISVPGGSINPPPPFRTVRIVTTDTSLASSATNTAVATISNYSPYTVHIKSWQTN